ncbi:ribose-phosphate pyrophosphokinase-like domain-containing protein [Streptomyces sp. NPDC020801]|uniref:ribose-phosphate pyrophosphokinase-like domain-containing protein n=1 Tax=unclassified Streptomyces TaxID=2593676 RepID=UPI003790B26C
MTPHGIIVGFCQGFTTDFPDQAPFVEGALRDAGWHVRTHHGFEGRFPDGELCIDLPEDPSGRTVLLCQSVTGTHTPADASLMSLLAAARSYREHGAGRIAAVLPHLAYARHDRHVPGQRRPVMAGLLADLATAAGLNDVVTIASGAENLLGSLFARSGTRLTFLPVHELHLDLLRPLTGRSTVLVAPDRGAADQVAMLAAALDRPLLVADKRRLGPEQVDVALRAPHDIGDVRHAVVVDDLITSAATVETVTTAIREHSPAARIDVIATHLRLTPSGARRLGGLLGSGAIRSVHTTDAAGQRPCVEGLSFTAAIPWMAPALTPWLSSQAARPDRRTAP